MIYFEPLFLFFSQNSLVLWDADVQPLTWEVMVSNKLISEWVVIYVTISFSEEDLGVNNTQ